MNTTILQEMLNIAIGGLVENEICSYCKIQHDQDHRCKNFDNCHSLIFQGLQKRAESGGALPHVEPDVTPAERLYSKTAEQEVGEKLHIDSSPVIEVEYDPMSKDEDLVRAERMAEMYSELI